MIKISNLSKKYGDVDAVKNVEVEISKGEICGLLGRNGAGKTTMMKMVTGYIEPSAGSVLINGKNVLDDRIEVQNFIGYMPENAPLYDEMLVQDYLLMIANLRNIPEDHQKKAICEAALDTGLEKYMTKPISTLSKGYRQRVGICQAILHKPDMLILDEPTNGLDPVQIIEIRKLIKKLAQDSTVIISTHILQEIEALCDRVLILIEGELVKDMPLKTFLSSNVIQLSIDNNVTEKQLKELIDEIKSLKEITKKEPDSTEGYTLYDITWDGNQAPVPEIIKLATKNNWKINSITSNPPSLEKAFGALMLEHAKKQNQESAA